MLCKLFLRLKWYYFRLFVALLLMKLFAPKLTKHPQFFLAGTPTYSVTCLHCIPMQFIQVVPKHPLLSRTCRLFQAKCHYTFPCLQTSSVLTLQAAHDFLRAKSWMKPISILVPVAQLGGPGDLTLPFSAKEQKCPFW